MKRKALTRDISIPVEIKHQFHVIIGGPKVGRGIRHGALQYLLPKVPAQGCYRLTARLNPRGPYHASTGGYCIHLRKAGKLRGVPFCWLPEAWQGRRVSLQISQVQAPTWKGNDNAGSPPVAEP